MIWRCWLLACATTFAVAAPPAPTNNYVAVAGTWDADWVGVLDVIMGDDLRLDPTSSQPKGFLSRVRTGSPGSLEDPTGSFLIFDGPRAAFRLRVPEWRSVDSFGFFALERRKGSRAVARLEFTRPAGAARAIPLARRVIATRNGLAHVHYETPQPDLGLAGGELRLVYESPDFASAFVGEIRVDRLGEKVGAHRDACVACPPRLLSWQQARAPDGITLHSLLVAVAQTGDKSTDVVPAWLVQPAPTGATAPLPLVVVVQDPVDPLNSLEALGMAGRPEYAVAPALARSGNAVLVVQLAGGDRDGNLHRLGALIEEVTRGSFARHAHVSFDADRLGILGYGDGAKLARALAQRDAHLRHVVILDAGDPRDAAMPGDRVRVIAIPFGIASRPQLEAIAKFFAGKGALQESPVDSVARARARIAEDAREFESATGRSPLAQGAR
jgi:hypothetical protein